MLVQASEEGGVLEDEERDMLHAVFDFGLVLVRQVMVPRTEMAAISADASVEEWIALATTHTFTKFPVYEGDLDHILGVVHTEDLVRAQYSERRSATVRGLMRDIMFVPETLRVGNLLAQFRANRQRIAIVLDEYGGTAGLVTLGDLIAEIIGEVGDPFDKSVPEIRRLPDGSALIEGTTPIETVNEHFGLELKDPNYDTIAGFVLGRLDRLAAVGDEVQADGARLKVEALDGLRIARVSLHMQGGAPAPSAETAG
jgi:CBS domain containing-hemolysin-like protein